ncbi:hypothetical protein RHGRI_001155 [Rhododendron griersonianum]|uniref:Uncharacterized protein n=1 Tax=Rhododendron griersonianum TaxID=479676 RepID=A0AAV6LM97_9ERIC|nr:hypothetical protein RHGRI_001155 [Rhododendron griersonianum]
MNASMEHIVIRNQVVELLALKKHRRILWQLHPPILNPVPRRTEIRTRSTKSIAIAHAQMPYPHGLPKLSWSLDVHEDRDGDE